jgi:class 3 adenylate cyclase/tetratricopeptide (TPR) repeat protein
VKFCGECGAALARVCAACGTSNEPGRKFCGECGSPLAETVAPSGDAPAVAVASAPVAERRLVSVLFADLVGFTSLSESRDLEDVRNVLSEYFETARRVIERYGGTVEKFIGDAVMAVWGTPTAREDDAERAVRAALELVDAVAGLGGDLQARAGVLTGEAAVTLGAEGQGMVAGDLVNTASRVQASAEPGWVLVGEATRRSSEAAVVYADAGEFALKGKAEPARLWRALRVTAGRGGERRSEGLEPPFVGRDRELRLVKELFHASAEQGKAHLLSVVGIAGIGKSRLAWELYKYLDGLAQTVYWHRGRCLAYGDGVTYWALVEMVRSRIGIAEAEEPRAAREKLRATLAEFVSDPEEREWVEPRVAHLLGLEERQPREKEELFGAWRLLFERIAGRGPAVLVFEDLQWADTALLEFVQYLLEWSRNHAILVLALARPDVADRHPGWPASARSATTLALEPLPDEAIATLLEGLVPGLPEEARERILARAEGVPLYAVETVRMLLDRGLLERAGDVYRPTGPLDALAVPETLHALAAARLDSLSADERLVIQDAAVLGKTFTTAGVAAVSGRTESELEPLLTALARREILGLQTDPRSPERGQYGFLQDLLRQVAYETLARPERKTRHLGAAAHLETLAAELDAVEVIASHYLAAYEADPEAGDAAGIRERARATLVAAGERAGSLAAATEAQRYFEQALELADDPREQARLHERAGLAARYAARLAEATAHLERALELFDASRDRRAAAQAKAELGEVAFHDDRIAEAVALLQEAFDALADDERDAELALVAAQLGRFLTLSGANDEAPPRLELALQIAEALRLPDVLSHALNTKGLLLQRSGRHEEGRLLLRHALELAVEHDAPAAAMRAYNNYAISLDLADRTGEVDDLWRRYLELALRVGDRLGERKARQALVFSAVWLGHWDRAEAEAAAGDDPQLESALLPVYLRRGQLDDARRALELAVAGADPDSPEGRAYPHVFEAALRLAEGNPSEALEHAEAALAEREALGILSLKPALEYALEAASALGESVKLDELLGLIEALPPGHTSPALRALASRFGAHRAALRGEPGVEEGFAAAAAIYRELGWPFETALVELEHGEWLVTQGRAGESEPLLAAAGEIFERLQAAPWIERARRVGSAETASTAVLASEPARG